MLKCLLEKVFIYIFAGSAGQTIVDCAENIHADLVIMGSRGLGSVDRMFLSSVTDYCMHHLKCAVLVVKQLV
jgi:nucleotide-binding universal stress UspA family protein